MAPLDECQAARHTERNDVDDAVNDHLINHVVANDSYS